MAPQSQQNLTQAGGGLRPWLVLGAFGLLQALVTVSIYTALGIALPLMVHDQHWSWTEAGFGFTVVGGCIGGSSYLPAIVIRRFGVRACLLLGTALVTGGLATFSLIHGLAPYFIGAALCGMGYQMMALIPANHMLSGLFRRRSSVLGLYFTLSAALGAGGPLAVLGLLRGLHNNWRQLWTIEAAIALGVGAACALLMGSPQWLTQASEALERKVEATPKRARRQHGVRGDWTLKAALRTPQFYVLLASYFGHTICLATTASFAMAHLTQRGISPLVVGGMLTLEAAAGAVWRLAAGVFGDFYDARFLLLFALVSLVIGMTALSVGHDYPSLIIFAVGSGIGFTVTPLAVMVLVVDYYGKKNNLEIFSTLCFAGTLAAFGPTFGGFMRDHFGGGFAVTFQVFAVFNAAVFLFAMFMRPPKAKTEGFAQPAAAAQAPLSPEGLTLVDVA